MDINLSRTIEQVLDKRVLDEPRDYVGASNIGNDCERAIWYGSKGIQESHIDNRIKRIFDTGKLLEGMILGYIELTDIKLVRPTEDNDWLECKDRELSFFKGHMDALLVMPSADVVVLDVKTCKDLEFKKFVSQGLRFWKPIYYTQLQAYLGMTGYKHACLLAFNKDDQRLHDETIEFDPIYYAALKEKARRIHLMQEPPEKINKSPMYYKCSYCTYKIVCHGKGEI